MFEKDCCAFDANLGKLGFKLRGTSNLIWNGLIRFENNVISKCYLKFSLSFFKGDYYGNIVFLRFQFETT